ELDDPDLDVALLPEALEGDPAGKVGGVEREGVTDPQRGAGREGIRGPTAAGGECGHEQGGRDRPPHRRHLRAYRSVACTAPDSSTPRMERATTATRTRSMRKSWAEVTINPPRPDRANSICARTIPLIARDAPMRKPTNTNGSAA